MIPRRGGVSTTGVYLPLTQLQARRVTGALYPKTDFDRFFSSWQSD